VDKILLIDGGLRIYYKRSGNSSLCISLISAWQMLGALRFDVLTIFPLPFSPSTKWVQGRACFEVSIRPSVRYAEGHYSFACRQIVPTMCVGSNLSKGQSTQPDKARRYLDLLDDARCDGRWQEIPELARKIEKHSPRRKCMSTGCATTEICSSLLSMPAC